MMDASQWQAVAEWLGVVWFISNAIVWGLFYRAQAAFVTRAEHSKTTDRLTEVERQITGLFTNDKATALVEKLDKALTQNSELIGKLPGVERSIDRLSRHIDMLMQNELEEKRK